MSRVETRLDSDSRRIIRESREWRHIHKPSRCTIIFNRRAHAWPASQLSLFAFCRALRATEGDGMAEDEVHQFVDTYACFVPIEHPSTRNDICLRR